MFSSVVTKPRAMMMRSIIVVTGLTFLSTASSWRRPQTRRSLGASSVPVARNIIIVLVRHQSDVSKPATTTTRTPARPCQGKGVVNPLRQLQLQLEQRRHTIASNRMLRVERGGESDPYYSNQEEENEDWYGTQQQQQQQQQQYQPYPYDTNDSYPGRQYNSAQQQQQQPEQSHYGNPYGTPPHSRNQAGFEEEDIDHLNDDPMRETVQDQVDRWKAVQQQQQSQQMEASLHDAQGRVKLMTTLGKGSRILTFVLLLWRDAYFYEKACNVEAAALSLIGQFYGGFLRVQVVFLMLLNGIGIVASSMASSSSSSHQTKKRLKAILNIHKLVELVLACWYFFRWITPSTTTVPREQWIGSMIHSFAFILHCQAVTKYSWDETSGRPLNSYQTTTTAHRTAHTTVPPNNSQSVSLW